MNTNKNSKRILCYGDSNTWGWVPLSMGSKRYSTNERWTCILQNLLGQSYEVIEEGLGARTTMFDDPRPEFPERNGLKTLSIILESHLPLDFVILMLGTTDTKEMMNLKSTDIAKGMENLIKTIKKFRVLDGTINPKILVIVPPIVKENTKFAKKLFMGATKKSTELIKLYENLCEKEKVLFLDPTKSVKVDGKEGIHINVKNHKILAKLIYNKLKNI
jgi:lysophospholipase L1-like esterase